MGGFEDYCVVFDLRNGFIKLDTNYCIWFEKWFEEYCVVFVL